MLNDYLHTQIKWPFTLENTKCTNIIWVVFNRHLKTLDYHYNITGDNDGKFQRGH